MAYGDKRRGGGRGKGNFQDRGFLSKNDYKEKDTHPSHKGKITLSPQLLQHLNDQYENGEELSLELSGWRKDDNPSMISLQVAKPYVKGEDGGGRRESRNRRWNEDEEDERPKRRVRARDEDEDEGDERPHRKRRGELTEDMDDDIPFKGRRRAGRYKQSDYGDEGDL